MKNIYTKPTVDIVFTDDVITTSDNYSITEGNDPEGGDDRGGYSDIFK